MTATTPAVPSSEELALELRRWCVKRQFTQHEEQMFADVIAALRAPAGNDGAVREARWLPISSAPESIQKFAKGCSDDPTRNGFIEFGGTIADGRPFVLCLANSLSTSNVFDRWFVLPSVESEAALPQREAGEPDRQRIHNMRVSLSGIATLAESAPIEFKTLKAIAKWARESLERDGGETGQMTDTRSYPGSARST